MTGLLTAIAVTGIPRITPGTDLVREIAFAIDRDRLALKPGDVLVIASKIVAKAEGALAEAPDRAAFEALVDAHSRGTVAARTYGRAGSRLTTKVVRTAAGTVQAAAGLDRSNAGGRVILHPADPDASAAALRQGLEDYFRTSLAVLLTDTSSRPWRQGVSDLVIGASGFRVLDSRRGEPDDEGRTQSVTVRGIADEVAAAADLVKGSAEGLPVAVVRGVAEFVDASAAGARTLSRPVEEDWFRWGHVEAIHRGLGASGEVRPAPHGDAGDDLLTRVERVLHVVRAGDGRTPGQDHWRLRIEGSGARITLSPTAVPGASTAGGHPLVEAAVGLGALVDRIHTALFAEDLRASVRYHWADTGIPLGADVSIELEL
ncbi:coenzyme F420-0:L-glutamate ligase [Brevibacterium samyangense]|uniref:Coenzyme F420-0:L-glutamate ligase n=1 Tax=Brevibacterium samyangense TaxID=366888 RepID=A0ABP5EU85_9MICO